MTRPHVWIDATEVSAGRQLWGMTLVERQVREIARGTARISASSRPQTSDVAVRPDLDRLYQVEIEMVEVVAGCEIFLLDRADGGLIFLSGDAVYDGRVLDYVVEKGGTRREAGRAAPYSIAVRCDSSPCRPRIGLRRCGRRTIWLPVRQLISIHT